MRTDPRRLSVLAALGVALAGCAKDEAAAELAAARSAFAEFQSALLRSEKDAVRWMLTRASRAVIDSLPWAAMATREPLEILGVRRVRGTFEVQVRDPNADGAESVYVVAREDSHFRIDLIETVAHNHTEHALEGAATRLRPSRLSPSQIGEIGAREAALSR